MSEKKGRRIWSKRVTWVLLHAVHFFQTYREVGELEIALSFALLQMSWGRWSWKYLTGDLPRPAAFQGRAIMGEHGAFFWSIFDSKNFFFYSSFFIAESQTGEDERESRASALSLSLFYVTTLRYDVKSS